MKKKKITVIISALILMSAIYYFFYPSHKIAGVHHFKNWNFNNKSDINTRIGNMPSMLLGYLKKLDSRDDYTEYSPTLSDRRLILETINYLPPLLKRAVQDRLAGIYFVNNFMGSGLTDWIIDDENSFYCYMVYNPVVLKNDLNSLLTWKENTCFISNSDIMRINLNIQSDENGFIYILLHESVHLADYCYHLTPFVEEAVKPYIKGTGKLETATRKYWENYSSPVFNFKNRENITFYGFSKGPRISITSAEELYTSLLESPFPSLYASLNWAEDICELLTFYHLTSKLGCHYQITIRDSQGKVHVYEPLKNQKVRNRFGSLQIFYDRKIPE